jgi:FkbM family methyltransferase
MSIPSRSFLLRHKIISTLRDWDIRGIRRLSVVLPKLLLPKPESVGKHVIRTIHGVELLIDPGVDKGVELSLFETGTYEKGTIQLLKDLLRPGSTFLDIGANIGLLSAIASKRVGETGKVVAVEANPKTVDILRHNLALNDCTNVEIYPLALGSENGTATLYENWDVNRGGASLLSQGDAEGMEVPVRRLDDLLTDEVIDVLKIDVEGFELEVLKGGLDLLKSQLPVLIIEVSEQRENEKGVTPQEIYAFVQTLGQYRFFKQKGTKERRSKLIPILSENDLPKHDNIVCIPMRRR